MLIDIATHGILTDGMGPSAFVLDLGANEGEFSRAMLSRFGCRALAVEPSREHCQRLTEIEGLGVVQAAVGSTDGTVEFHVSQNRQSSTVCPVSDQVYDRIETVESVAFESLLHRQQIARIDLMKVDIEGAEVDLFRGITDERLRSIAQISIEFHDFNGMISPRDADALQDRLSAIGFRRIQLSRTNRENVLFFNPRRCGLSRPAELYARLITRNVLGVGRVLARRRKAKHGQYDSANQ